MDKNKSKLGIYFFERGLEPQILLLAERPRPIAPVAIALRRVAKRIEHNELGIPPFPLLVVLRQPNELVGLMIASVKTIGFRIGKQALARLSGPNRRPPAT